MRRRTSDVREPECEEEGGEGDGEKIEEREHRPDRRGDRGMPDHETQNVHGADQHDRYQEEGAARDSTMLPHQPFRHQKGLPGKQDQSKGCRDPANAVDHIAPGVGTKKESGSLPR